MSVSQWWNLAQSMLLRSQLPSQRSSKLRPTSSQWQDPYYRFQSIAELQLAAAKGVRLDVNQATVDDWLRLPGLSIHQARSLVALTQAGVQFHGLEDIAAALSLPLQRLSPLAPILQFCYYEQSGLAPTQINLNRASCEQLLQLPDVEVSLATAIVADRQQRGAYRNLTDLQQRLQLPGETIAKLMHYLYIN